MKWKLLCCMLLILFLAACGPVTMVGPTPGAALPDLAIQSAYVSDVDENDNCLHTLVILTTLVNRGNAPAYNVTLVETATGTARQAQVLGVNEKLVVQFPLAPGGRYTVVADPDNSVMESDETNNSLSYLAPTPTPSIPCAPTLPVDVTPVPTLVSLPPSRPALDGLIYANLSTGFIARVLAGGHSQDLLQGGDAAFSPDGRFVAFASGGDLYLAEPMDNPGRNLTNTPDRTEMAPQWWAADPSRIVFHSVGVDEPGAKGWTHSILGYVGMISADGAGYVTLSDEPSNSMPALSPDGRTIAFDKQGWPWLYEIGAGARPFRPEEFGFSGTPPEGIVYTASSFSPDGTRLTWWVSQDESQPQRNFVLVAFDLAGKTAATLHSYAAPQGTLGWLPNPLWSPDGQWIAYSTREEVTPSDLWISRPDGTDAYRLGLATNPVWSPYSRQLAYQQGSPPSSDQPSVISIVEAPSWAAGPASLPAGSIPLAWVPSPGSEAIYQFPTYPTPDTWRTYSNPNPPYTVRYPPDARLEAYPESLTIHLPFPPGTQMVDQFVRIETVIVSEADCTGQGSWTGTARINGVDYRYRAGRFWDSTPGGRSYFLSQFATFHGGFCFHLSIVMDLQDPPFGTGGTPVPYPASPEQDLDDLLHIVSTLQLQGE